MDILVGHLSLTAQAVTWVAFALVVFISIWRAPWFHLQEVESLNILLAMIVGIMVMWTVKAGLVAGLTIHLLGTTLLTLMFGWAFAILGNIAILISHSLVNGEGWLALPLEALLLGAIPAIVSNVIFRVVDRKLPNNFFIYIFVAAFFGAALAVASAVFGTTVLHVASGAYSAVEIWRDYTRFALLVIFPEAFITGMLMTLFVVYRPEWVCTFDDNRYLVGK